MKIADASIIAPTVQATAGNASAPRPEALRAAREFEQIFLRKMLSVLEKTGRPQGSGAATAGSDIYSSMVVNSLAEAISTAGGIGLADVIARSTMDHNPPASTPQVLAPLTPTPSVQGVPLSLPTPELGASSRTRR